MAIALKTKELREEQNMTQMDLALELGLRKYNNTAI